MKRILGKRFWAAMLIFGLAGQIAWVVENMYFNVFIYKMFHASPADISLMVGASSVAATVTTILMGALSDKIGKRKLFICGGYILWGITILSFAFIRVDILTPVAGSVAAACSLGVTLVIIMDCVMTFFGSMANDAAYNAWLTDRGDESNRGKIEGLNSMMPLVSILVVFGGFMGLDLNKAESWTMIYLIIGILVLVIGTAGFFLIEEAEGCEKAKTVSGSYWETVFYSFRPAVLKENQLLYAVLGAFALFGISIQTYMPYLILYYEQSLGLNNYVLIMAPAIIIAAGVTAWYGRIYDVQGFKGSVVPSIGILMSGYVILFFSRTAVPVFIGSLFMMMGYMTGMAVFGAMIRDKIPQNRAGQFQGIRIISQVLIPGIVGPAIGAWVLRNAKEVVNQDGTTSFLPHEGIWAAAFVAGIALCVALGMIFHMMRMGHHNLWSECGEELREEKVLWTKHPRPQMRRDHWMNLNGEWKLNGNPIRVPYAPQAKLSGYTGKIGDHLEYEKIFWIPDSFVMPKVLLHFGAVDQIAQIWVNGAKVGEHEGGYLPFTFDITDVIHRGKENVLRVRATDTLSHDYPYGKQTKKRGGMWYTPVSGIWKTVWLENVPEAYMKNITITPDLEGVTISVEGAENGFAAEVKMEHDEIWTVTSDGASCRLDLKEAGYIPKLWTPENPHLYSMTISAGEDKVESYFALRTISIEEKKGIQRVCLNGEPIFMHGVLDQGYFCDGLFLPAEEEEYERDILRMKELGYNMLRKHIKVEPEYFYYACDRLGMLVMQDMVNNGPYHYIGDTALPTFGFRTRRDDKGKMDGRRQQIFIQHCKETIEHLYNHPCIVAHTIFNEGWGQFYSDALYHMVKEWDPTRLVDSTSGWFAQKENDFDSEHIYFREIPMMPKTRPMFMSECGGYSMVVEGHYYSKYATYGYGACDNSHELTQQIAKMYEIMILPAIEKGMCGCVYTQLSDVEDEINGLYTYDRKVCKVEPERMRQLAAEIEKAVKEG